MEKNIILATNIIKESLSNKYNSLSDTDIIEIVTFIYACNYFRKDVLQKFPDIQHDILHDIINQIITIDFIYKNNSKIVMSFDTLIHLQSLLFNIKNIILRNESLKIDNKFTTELNSHKDIKEAIDTLLIPKLNLVKTFSDKTLSDKINLLSEIFYLIICIHPFKDGNGRTARYTINLISIMWGYNLFPVPKVRNNAEWYKALNNAVETKNYSLIVSHINKFFTSTNKL